MQYVKSSVVTLALLLFSTGIMANNSLETDTLELTRSALASANAAEPAVTEKTKAPFTEKKEDMAANTALLTLHPRAIPFVKDYLEIHEGRLTRMKSTALPYFLMIEKILVARDLPKELKYLAVIESDLKSSARSWAGAVGPWQFMPETGRLMGLKISKYRDERKDLNKSTYAAARYLQILYDQLHDWLLVIAAYNGGPARVEAAIRKTGSRNFWDLQYHLPAESRNHVKKFIATHYIMEGQGGITTTGANDMARLDAIQMAKDLENTTVMKITGRYNSMVIVKTLLMDPVLFSQLNPGFDAKVAVDEYSLRLPDDKMKLFQDKKMEILEESVQLLLATPAPPEAVLPKQAKK